MGLDKKSVCGDVLGLISLNKSFRKKFSKEETSSIRPTNISTIRNWSIISFTLFCSQWLLFENVQLTHKMGDQRQASVTFSTEVPSTNIL